MPFISRKATAPPAPKTPDLETILKNMVRYTEGNNKALNKYEFTNLIGALGKMHSSLATNYYKTKNGKWAAYHKRGGSLKNMLLEDIGLYGTNSFQNYLNNYQANPNMYK